MANRWGKVETVTDFIFLGSKITADSDCSHEIKRHFLLGRKAMTNLDSILKSIHITLPTKVLIIVKAMVFPEVMYGCESWRRLLRVPWTARRSNQSILKEISSGWCWSWSSNTLAAWCEELTPWKRPWCWKRLKAGGEGDDRECDGWMASPTRWTWVCAALGVGDAQGSLACCSSWVCKESDTTQQVNNNNSAKYLLAPSGRRKG